MEKILSLFKILCPFCKITPSHGACSTCAEQMVRFDCNQGQNIMIDERLELFFLGDYEDWLRTIILKQKNGEHHCRPVIEWLATRLAQLIPENLRQLPLVWIPANPFKKVHLVEAIAHALTKRGLRLVPYPILLHTIMPYRAQKELRLSRRMSRNMSSILKARVMELPNNKVLLFDDVLTTGTTMLGAKQALRNVGIDCSFAISIAYTQKRVLT